MNELLCIVFCVLYYIGIMRALHTSMSCFCCHTRYHNFYLNSCTLQTGLCWLNSFEYDFVNNTSLNIKWMYMYICIFTLCIFHTTVINSLFMQWFLDRKECTMCSSVFASVFFYYYYLLYIFLLFSHFFVSLILNRSFFSHFYLEWN